MVCYDARCFHTWCLNSMVLTSLSEFFFVPFIISKRLQNVIFREVNWRKLRPVSLKRSFFPFSSKHFPRVTAAGDGSTSSQWFVKAVCSELCPHFSATPGPLALGRERKERLLEHPPLQPRFIASPAKRTPGQLVFGRALVSPRDKSPAAGWLQAVTTFLITVSPS